MKELRLRNTVNLSHYLSNGGKKMIWRFHDHCWLTIVDSFYLRICRNLSEEGWTLEGPYLRIYLTPRYYTERLSVYLIPLRPSGREL